MEELQFTHMLYAIAAGLYEKEHCYGKYPYSNHLMYGMNLLAALMVRQGQLDGLSNMHESAFLEQFASRPVKEWFSGWGEAFQEKIRHTPLFQTGALIVPEEGQGFHITEDCADLYGNAEADLFNALEQNHVYQKIRELSAEDYSIIRLFLVQHPICSDQKLRTFKIRHRNPDLWAVLENAYEHVPEKSYRCPECGWTMQFHGQQAICCNRSCTAKHPNRENLDPIDPIDQFRLVHGVMRYMCLPGKLELAIQEKAIAAGCKTILWPDHDQYDIQIILPGGQIWAVDAKTHRNPYMLANAIKTDGRFANVQADKRYYVIPKERKQEYPDYCDICCHELDKSRVDCITDMELYRMLRRWNADENH